jgi:hypothetical protein
MIAARASAAHLRTAHREIRRIDLNLAGLRERDPEDHREPEEGPGCQQREADLPILGDPAEQ